MNHSKTALNGHKKHSSDTPTGVHKAKDLAEQLGIAPQTLSSRWYKWLKEVTDPSLLKANGRYTDLARDLFFDFKAEVKEKEVDAWEWVKSRKELMETDFEDEPVKPNVTPENADSALAVIGDTQDLVDQLMEGLSLRQEHYETLAGELVEGTVAQEINLFDEELLMEAKLGAMRGAKKYAVRKKAEAQTINALQRQDLEGKRQEAGI